MSKLQVRIFDGSRRLFALPADFFITIIDGNQTRRVWQDYQSNDILFDLPFFDNFGDNYSVIVSSKGCKQAGFVPVKLSNAHLTILDLMLVPNNPGFNFAEATFAEATEAYPFLGSPTDPAAQKRYDDLLDQSQLSLACLLNLGEAMSQINLPQGTPIDYIKQIRWDKPPAQDRFFAWCDALLVDQVRRAAQAGLFAVEYGADILHPGATNSWKQVQFGEANVQLTFHEHPEDTAVIDGVKCVTLEPDMDYYRDPLAHVLLEVVPNALTHTLTNPAEVYVLRWIAGRTARVPEFAPLYNIV